VWDRTRCVGGTAAVLWDRTLQGNVDQLLRDMQRAIDEADSFVRALQKN